MHSRRDLTKSPVVKQQKIQNKYLSTYNTTVVKIEKERKKTRIEG